MLEQIQSLGFDGLVALLMTKPGSKLIVFIPCGSQVTWSLPYEINLTLLYLDEEPMS